MKRGALTRTGRTAAWALVVALLAAWPAPETVAQRGSPAMREKRDAYYRRYIGRPAPPFSLPDRSGRTVRLADFRGRVVILNFWFSTCPPCRKETPDLIRLYEAHREEGLTVIGINLDPILIPRFQGAQMERFLKTFEITYPILIGDDAVFEAYGEVPVQPTTFVIDRDGKVDRIFWGAFPASAFDMAVRPLLAASPVQPPAPAAERPSGP